MIADGFTIVNLLGLAILLIWVVKIIVFKQLKSPTHFHVFYFLLSVWIVLSVGWASNYELFRPINTAIGFLMTFGIMYIMWDLYDTEKHLHLALQSFIFGSYTIIFGLFHNFIIGQVDVGDARYQTFVIANYIPLYLIISALFSAFLLKNSDVIKQSRYIKIVNIIFIPFAVIGVLLTGSRQGFVALFPLLFYILYISSTQYRTYLFKMGPIIPVLMTFAYSIIPTENVARVTTIGPSLIKSGLNNRLDRWVISYDAFINNLGTGTGIGTNRYVLEERMGEFVTTHNSFLRLSMETGIIGLILFSCSIFFVFRSILNQKHRIFSLMIVSVLIILSVFNDWYNRPEFWLSLNFIILLQFVRPENDN